MLMNFSKKDFKKYGNVLNKFERTVREKVTKFCTVAILY